MTHRLAVAPLVKPIRKGSLSGARALDMRYAHVNPKQPFIARVKIAPVKSG